MISSERLTAEQRIRKQDAFKDLVENGKFMRGRFFYLWVARQPQVGIEPIGRPMLGVVVNKKTQAKAVGRNKIKRRVREFFRTRQGEIRPDLALLIKAREGRAMPGKEDVEADLGELFIKTGALL